MNETFRMFIAWLGATVAMFGLAVPSILWSERVVGPALRGTQFAIIGAMGMIGIALGGIWLWHWSYGRIKRWLDGR